MTSKPPPTKRSSASWSETVTFLKQLWQRWLAFQPKLIGFFQAIWQTSLSWVQQLRVRLPETWRSKLPDARVLNGILLAVLAVVLWSVLSSGFSSLFAKVPQPAQLSDRPAAAPLNDSAPPIAASQPAQEAEQDVKRIATIQKQLATVSDRYATDLVESVRVSFRRSRLTVQVSDAWYGLDALTQDKLAKDIWQRARKLKFDRLEIANGEAELLARSPVVGTEMLVLERSADLDLTSPS